MQYRVPREPWAAQASDKCTVFVCLFFLAVSFWVINGSLFPSHRSILASAVFCFRNDWKVGKTITEEPCLSRPWAEAELPHRSCPPQLLPCGSGWLESRHHPPPPHPHPRPKAGDTILFTLKLSAASNARKQRGLSLTPGLQPFQRTIGQSSEVMKLEQRSPQIGHFPCRAAWRQISLSIK